MTPNRTPNASYWWDVILVMDYLCLNLSLCSVIQRDAVSFIWVWPLLFYQRGRKGFEKQGPTCKESSFNITPCKESFGVLCRVRADWWRYHLSHITDLSELEGVVKCFAQEGTKEDEKRSQPPSILYNLKRKSQGIQFHCAGGIYTLKPAMKCVK